MTPKNKGICVLSLTFMLTNLIHFVKDFQFGDVNANWLIWFFFAWNYFAYAFDKQMLPWVFEELQGHGKGEKTTRAIFFWGFALMHFAFLGVMAFAD